MQKSYLSAVANNKSIKPVNRLRSFFSHFSSSLSIPHHHCLSLSPPLPTMDSKYRQQNSLPLVWPAGYWVQLQYHQQSHPSTPYLVPLHCHWIKAWRQRIQY